MKVRGSYIWALAILLVLGAWLASGELSGQANTASTKPQAEVKSTEIVPTVRVMVVNASMRRADLIVRGRTEAVRRVDIRSEIAGRVIAAPVVKGTMAKAGAVLCEIDMAARQAVLLQAQASLEQMTLDYEAATKLSKRGFASRTKKAADRAKYNAALAVVERAKLAVDRTKIVAPFTGIVEAQPAKVGAYLGIGDICAMLVEMQPILIVAQVSERQIDQLSVGMDGVATLVGGGQITGKIRYIASVADTATRTFRVELEIANPGSKIRAGLTAEMRLPLVDISAHRFSSAILTLNDDGVIGVRIVVDNDLVRFVAVQIIDDGVEGVWVTGLPAEAKIITVGQDYVREGQKVSPTMITSQDTNS
ncbi:MAG: efflux RND transporter periplasmic adaptor subunit [Alphaproteobacteria bacterium]